jgi:putative phosphoesterase
MPCKGSGWYDTLLNEKGLHPAQSRAADEAVGTTSMRIAALYDIHANLPALESVLEEIGGLAVDQIVIGGDVVPGPMPRETIALLHSLKIPVHYIQGNGDRVVLAQMRGQESAEVPLQFREVIRWNAQELRRDYESFLTGWPKTLAISIPGLGKVLFCHATPQNDTDIFTRLTVETRVSALLEGVEASCVVCGHTHMQFDRTVDGIRVVNAGSVGMPFQNPGAYWLLLGPAVELRRTGYDLAQAAERIRKTEYPQAHDFAARNVLQPPTEQETLASLARIDPR